MPSTRIGSRFTRTVARSGQGAATAVAVGLCALLAPGIGAQSDQARDTELERGFTTTVRPFVATYCAGCHGGAAPAAQFDLRAYTGLASVVADHRRWDLVLERLSTNQMPPARAQQPPIEARRQMVAWIEAMRTNEARKHAGDPGVVLARRLSNAEYNYTIRDLTGADIRPAREFPVDPANQAGFDNSGESLAMSPALLTKYLQAAREVASHLVLTPRDLTFASHPVLAETDRDRYAVMRIVDFYRRQPTNYRDYFDAAWRFKHRRAGGRASATLAGIATERQLSARYLATIWRALEGSKADVGPLATLQGMWRAAEMLDERQRADAMDRMREYVERVRRKIAFTLEVPEFKGLADDSQPMLMWRNRQYASHRLSYDRALLNTGTPIDPDLLAPPAQRARYEEAFAQFSATFPDAFYISERGRYFPDTTRDTGRHLSAGFHNLMGYFRDDAPLYELILDDRGRRELDAMWQDLEFVASATSRTYVQFYLSESGERRNAGPASGTDGELTASITSEPMIQRVADAYRARASATGNAIAMAAVNEHFTTTNTTIRWLEKARVEAEPRHLQALQQFAARAYRRPLSASERDDLLRQYRESRAQGLDHEEAMRDSVVAILMSPDFCYRLDLAADEPRDSSPGSGAVPLSGYALASRLSYFLWSSMPDAELLARAAAGDLQKPDVLAAQGRRLLRDPRARGLATEFGGHWLDFRRFGEHNAVDRERFPSFTSELRDAMFEEPIRFILDVVQNNRPILDFLYANDTFVNAPLARHYGMPAVADAAWIKVDASPFGRGGVLPMGVFLTKNAPGLRTSPVKRGYWVVKNVLGERIPPPPAAVPELPRDEARLDLPLRALLARHREDPGCASCHARFDALGLVFEGYGPVGERRTTDLSGRPVDVSATFPGGATGSGVDGLRDYLRQYRQDDFVNNLSRKLLSYSLNRSLMLSDEPLIESIRAALAGNAYRFDTLIERIVTSPQFRNTRARE
jgi:mono/diheme cytochrome c family protein